MQRRFGNPARRPCYPVIGGDFSDAVVRAYETAAAGGTGAANPSHTAAVESAAGLLARAFAAAKVTGPEWAVRAINPVVLSQIGRDLITAGDSLHVIDVRDGQVFLLPVSSWHFEGPANPLDWMVRATTFGPSTSTTMLIPYAGVVFVRWGSNPGTPYVGVAPSTWATTTGRLHSETERALADEIAGPMHNVIPTPPAGAAEGDDDDPDAQTPLDLLAGDITKNRGGTLLVETTSEGFGEGRASAPQRDWDPKRLGANPPQALAQIRADTFDALLAAAGTPPALMDGGADGTSQRESLRRWHQTTVLPLAGVLAWELSEKLETPISLSFDGYATDMQSRAAVIKALVAAGVDLDKAINMAWADVD